MLYESDVISAVCDYLEERDHKILQRLNERQRGDDIISIDPNGNKCFIEAKGETSSQRGTSRFGQPFNSSQAGVHVAKAFYRAAQMKQENQDSCKVAIALPNTNLHLEKIRKINSSLKLLSIEVFWVNHDKSVEVVGNWT